ncbi:MAG: hypothetical protein KDA24_23920 [Deltaproteobacteria bacterium]|nr:hypothetical protein [Deltaproteobacteria bacterium]
MQHGSAYILGLALFLVGCPGSGGLGGDAPDPTTPEDITLATLDGLTIAGTFQAAPGADRGPALLLLHQFERDRSDFDVIWDDLLGAGYSLLAIDFRSHGLSDEATVPINTLLSDRDQLRFDVMAGLDDLTGRPREIDPARVGAVGLSVGGNMAIVANHNTHGNEQAPWGCAAIATVSARKDRAEDLAGDNTLTLRDGLYIAGADETVQAEEAGALVDDTGGGREAMLVPGTSAHGVDLLNDEQDVRDRIVQWFGEVDL